MRNTSTYPKGAAALKQQRLGQYRPPIAWDPSHLVDIDDNHPSTVEYEIEDMGVKEKIKVELFDGSTRTEGAVRLLLSIDEYTEHVFSHAGAHPAQTREQVKVRKLKQWTKPPAREHVTKLLSDKLTLESGDTDETKPIAQWIQEGTAEEKDIAWKEMRSRFIRQYAGEKPYDREREYLVASLPKITLDATEQDLRDWFQRLETLSGYLETLHYAQHPFMDDNERGQVTLTSRSSSSSSSRRRHRRRRRRGGSDDGHCFGLLLEILLE